MLSGSPIRFGGGKLRSSLGTRYKIGDTFRTQKKGLKHSMYVHSLAYVQRTRNLDVVDGLREFARYRLMKERQEASWA